jgi:DNA-binding FadR family transcriptional regulator
MNPSLPNSNFKVDDVLKASHKEKAHAMKKRYFGEESVFEFIWNNADGDGVWVGGAATVARKFGVSENESHEVLSDLCDRGLIQRIGGQSYIIMKWRERDDLGEQELAWWEFATGLRHR